MGGEGEEDEYPDEESELMDRLRMYSDLYEEYLEQVEELQLLDDFIYKLRSLGYSDKHIMNILEELESEAIYESEVNSHPQYPQVSPYDQEEADEESSQFKRAASYGYSEPEKRHHEGYYEDEEEPERKRHDDEEEDEDEEEEVNDIDEDLESEFESLRQQMDQDEEAAENQLTDEEEMLQSELGADEEESGELMEELGHIEGIVRRLEQEEGWTPHQIREFFLEEFGIDLLFDDDDEVDGFYEEGDNEEAQEKEAEEEGEEVKRHDDEYEDEDEDEDEDESEDEYDDELDKDDEDDNEEDEVDDEEESAIRNMKAYPFRKRSLEEIKAKKQDLDKDNDGIAGEQFWLGGEGEEDPNEEGEEESAVKKMDRNMENIYSRLGYLEFQPH